ncbi:hypothetical protein E4U13_000351 [Claviceps humidiphila]|uniref:Peroxisomal biogenesis factor 3 n=1 Tax=Claviceps humidiphila TaxID=1294629 RepID=A0A9P7Q3R5_9HYPO|nr:hypothetical protein E4U13_000351 [Claviceps humidiphila]
MAVIVAFLESRAPRLAEQHQPHHCDHRDQPHRWLNCPASRLPGEAWSGGITSCSFRTSPPQACRIMFSSARRWLRNNRTSIACGVGIIGTGYIAAQYVLNKIVDARERMSSDRIAQENLRRRFEQNQEDCTFTVLALLPTATSNVLSEMKTEQITYEIQQIKGSARGAKQHGVSESTTLSPPSIADTSLTEEDGKSMATSASLQSESGVHASQIAVPTPLVAAGSDAQQQPDAAVPATPKVSRKTKRQLWDDLTISAITRAFTLIYTLALLTMLTRVQLNLLGRRSYLSSVVTLATGAAQATINLENNDDDDDTAEPAYGSDFDTNRKYLTFSWWLLNKGWAQIMHRVESAVRTVFGSLSPRDLVSFDRFTELTMQVRKLVEGSSTNERQKMNWLPFLLPPPNQEDEVLRQSGILLNDDSPPSTQPDSTASSSVSRSAGLRRLLDETADLLESPSFSHVLTLLLDTAFETLVDKKLATEAFELPPQISFPPPETMDLRASRVILLPKILSVLTRQAHVIGNGVPNEYLQDMETVRALTAFAAVVYSSNWDKEMCHDDDDDYGIMDSAIDIGGLGEREPRSRSVQGGVEAGDGGKRPVLDESIVVVDAAEDGFQTAWEKAVQETS